MWRQPKAFWVVAFASVVAFLGIGLVNPILKPIPASFNASPSQVLLLFTSYLAVMGCATLITDAVASRIGPKRTLLLGLLIIIAGAGLAGLSDTVMAIVGWRALWGLGNALFIATTLATIVSLVRGSPAHAIILYEAALGLGIAVGTAKDSPGRWFTLHAVRCSGSSRQRCRARRKPARNRLAALRGPGGHLPRLAIGAPARAPGVARTPRSVRRWRSARRRC